MMIKKCLAAMLAVTFFAASQLAQAANLPDFSDLAAKSGPAVVNIGTERKASGSSQDDLMGEMFRNMPPGFDKFFDQFGGKRGGKRPQNKQKSLGSGFIVSADGYIVTNNHVVADADIIRVTLDQSTGKSEAVPAKLVGADEETDLALLKIETSKPLPFLSFGNSGELKVGEWLLAIGNPFGLDHTVTAGILSAKNRNIHAGPFDNFLQTDASINPGNSGGPLLNMAGQVIGINTAIIASGQGLGFAIPSNMASKIIEQIKSGKKVTRGWIGVGIQDVEENTAKALGLKEAKGALVGSVMEGEPASKAGMKAGDIIVSVDGTAIEDAAALLRLIADKAPGSKAAIAVWRDGKTTALSVTLGERKTSQSGEQSDKDPKQKNEGLLGISVRSLTDEERRDLKIEKNEGLVITDVNPDKPAAEADLRPGDVILKANLKPVHDAAELSKIVTEEGAARGAIMLQISRRGDVYFRTVSLGK